MSQPKPTHFDTLSVHAGARPDPATGARATPIYQTTSFVFPDSEPAAALFNMERAGHVYSRISNPTNAVLEERIAALEGGVGAIATASGQAALHLAIATLMGAGAHIVASAALYGGSHNLLDYTLPRFGIETTFVDPRDLDAWRGRDPPEHAAAVRRDARQSRARRARHPAGRRARARGRAAAAGRFDVHHAVPDAAVRARRRPGVPLGDQVPGGHGVAIGGVLVDSGASTGRSRRARCSRRSPSPTPASTTWCSTRSRRRPRSCCARGAKACAISAPAWRR